MPLGSACDLLAREWEVCAVCSLVREVWADERHKLTPPPFGGRLFVWFCWHLATKKGRAANVFTESYWTAAIKQRASVILGEDRRHIILPFVKFVEMSLFWRRRKALTQARQHGWTIS